MGHKDPRVRLGLSLLKHLSSLLQMAKSQFKAGGPTRGRLRVRKMGMGSGASVAKLKARGNSKTKKG